MIFTIKRTLFSLTMLGASAALAWAQGNYEIQVYGADTVAPGRTMVEIHSNFTIECSTLLTSSPSKLTPLPDGTLPTNHQLH